MLNVQTRGAHSALNIKRERLCREILTKYLGSPSLIRRPDFLKTQEYPNGLELDIFYPQY